MTDSGDDSNRNSTVFVRLMEYSVSRGKRRGN
jgi:hypothetical protein